MVAFHQTRFSDLKNRAALRNRTHTPRKLQLSKTAPKRNHSPPQGRSGRSLDEETRDEADGGRANRIPVHRNPGYVRTLGY